MSFKVRYLQMKNLKYKILMFESIHLTGTIIPYNKSDMHLSFSKLG